MTEQPEINRQIRFYQVDQLYKRLPISASLSLAAITFVALLLWSEMNHILLLAWWSVASAIYIARWLLVLTYKRRQPTAETIETWAKRFFLGTCGGGLSWGFAAFFLFPGSGLAHQLFLILVIAGMASMAVTTLSPVKINITVFLCLLLIPAFVRLLLMGGSIYMVMSAFALLYLVASLLISRYIHMVFLDAITLRLNSMQQAEELRESEERYRDIFENATDLIQCAAADGHFLYVNRAWCERLGYSEAEVAGLTFLDIVHPSCREHCNTIFRELFRGQDIGKVETIFITKSGREVLVEGSVSCRFQYGNPVSTRGIFRDITVRRQAEEKTINALREKEVLLKEIHHRVKNNLQTIISLLNLQSRFIEDRKAIEVFEKSRERIRAMALIHEKLCESVDSEQIDFRGYINNLTNQLYHSYSINIGRVQLNTKIEEIALDMDTALPLAFIINELVSNSLGHAFPGDRKGELYIELGKNHQDRLRQQDDDPDYTLIIKDNGIGLPGNLDIANSRSLGMLLVHSLVRQLHGVLTVANDGGAAFTIKFKRLKYRKRI